MAHSLQRPPSGVAAALKLRARRSSPSDPHYAGGRTEPTNASTLFRASPNSIRAFSR